MITTCAQAQSHLSTAQAAWNAFVNGDFVNAAAVAERRRVQAIQELQIADRDARACGTHDPTRSGRARLHAAVALVDARRRGDRRALESGADVAVPVVPTVAPGACTSPNLPPQPLSAITPVELDLGRLRRPHGSTVIGVNVDALGNVVGATVQSSSGDPNLDQDVVTAAQRTPFRAALVGCRASAGTYTFAYTFPQQY